VGPTKMNQSNTVGHASGVTGGIGQTPLVVTDNPHPTGGGTHCGWIRRRRDRPSSWPPIKKRSTD